jgi:pyrroloquinoline quinone (PQQ) biosynthesis protein C
MKARIMNDSSRLVEPGPAQPLPPAQEIVAVHERLHVAAHPFFCRLRSAPVDLEGLWILMANLRAGISRHFVVWLATVIARMDDRRISCLVARQLNDELGNGRTDQIHSQLLDRFVSGLERWRSNRAAEHEVLRPGQRLADTGARPFRAQHAYEGVGAVMAGEIFAKKMHCCVGDEIRRQTELSASTLDWLAVHESLEVHHAEDSRALAELIPASGEALEATWRGAFAQWQALWRFLDEVHRVALAVRN